MRELGRVGKKDLLLGKEEGALTEGIGIAGQVVDSKDTAHGDLVYILLERKGGGGVERREENKKRQRGSRTREGKGEKDKEGK
jgi:hypothetical protein